MSGVSLTRPKKTDYTVDDWCYHRNISRAQYYRMVAAGDAPQHYYVGTRRRISVESDTEWLQKKEAEAKEKDRIEYARKVNAPVESLQTDTGAATTT